jgi:hypothetical protein
MIILKYYYCGMVISFYIDEVNCTAWTRLTNSNRMEWAILTKTPSGSLREHCRGAAVHHSAVHPTMQRRFRAGGEQINGAEATSRDLARAARGTKLRASEGVARSTGVRRVMRGKGHWKGRNDDGTIRDGRFAEKN